MGIKETATTRTLSVVPSTGSAWLAELSTQSVLKVRCGTRVTNGATGRTEYHATAGPTATSARRDVPRHRSAIFFLKCNVNSSNITELEFQALSGRNSRPVALK